MRCHFDLFRYNETGLETENRVLRLDYRSNGIPRMVLCISEDKTSHKIIFPDSTLLKSQTLEQKV